MTGYELAFWITVGISWTAAAMAVRSAVQSVRSAKRIRQRSG